MPISTLQSGSFPSNVAIDTDTLVVDGANNRVGVGTASPAQPLHVVGGAVQFQNTQSTYLQVNTSDTHLYTAGAHPLRFGSNNAEVVRVETGGLTFTPATNNLYTVSGTLSYYGTTNNVYLNGASSGGMIMSGNGNRNQYVYLNSVSDSVMITTNTLERLGIDSSGRVTMPSQPAFHAYGTTAAWTVFSNGGWSTIVLPATALNTGNHYNTASSAFTAPVAGVYHFYYKVYGRVQSGAPASTYWQSRFQKNNAGISGYSSMIMAYYYNDGGKDETATYSMTISLAANDQITLHAQSAGAYNGEYYPPNCEFGGYLIG